MSDYDVIVPGGGPLRSTTPRHWPHAGCAPPSSSGMAGGECSYWAPRMRARDRACAATPERAPSGEAAGLGGGYVRVLRPSQLVSCGQGYEPSWGRSRTRRAVSGRPPRSLVPRDLR
jgi:hypothetical protein